MSEAATNAALGPDSPPPLRLVVVTGLSGAGKQSILRVLEDLGYETVDNPPISLLEDLATHAAGNMAIGIDARTRGFDDAFVLEALERLHNQPGLHPELVYAWADRQTLLRRYTESRRRHPLAPMGRVSDGIELEERITARARAGCDLLVDTSDLPIPAMRRMIERHFGGEPGRTGKAALTVSVLSFAYPSGLPREADLVLDARFLRNPHYDAALRPLTGLDEEVGAYVEADTDYPRFEQLLFDLTNLLLPRFVTEGKKYATFAIGCTGGRHRSVWMVEKLAAHLRGAGWRIAVTHSELARQPAPISIGIGSGGPIPSLATPAQGDLTVTTGCVTR
jgi:RNase adapter protein RapZ